MVQHPSVGSWNDEGKSARWPDLFLFGWNGFVDATSAEVSHCFPFVESKERDSPIWRGIYLSWLFRWGIYHISWCKSMMFHYLCFFFQGFASFIGDFQPNFMVILAINFPHFVRWFSQLFSPWLGHVAHRAAQEALPRLWCGGTRQGQVIGL